jgi:hypothetical protein
LLPDWSFIISHSTSKSPETKEGWTAGGCPSYLRDSCLAFDRAQHTKICQVAVACDIDDWTFDQASASLIDLTPKGLSPPSTVNPRTFSINQGSSTTAVTCGAWMAASVIDLTPESISKYKIVSL